MKSRKRLTRQQGDERQSLKLQHLMALLCARTVVAQVALEEVVVMGCGDGMVMLLGAPGGWAPKTAPS